MSRKRVKKKHNGTGGRKKRFAPLVYRTLDEFEREVILPITEGDWFEYYGIACLAQTIMYEMAETYRDDEAGWKEFQEFSYNRSNNYRKMHGYPMKRMIRHN